MRRKKRGMSAVGCTALSLRCVIGKERDREGKVDVDDREGQEQESKDG